MHRNIIETVLGAVVIHFAGFFELTFALLSLSALVGSFGISYARARAECEIKECRVGFWERGERLGVLSLALLLNNLEACVWLLGIGTHWTFFQRMILAKIQTGNNGPAARRPFYLQSRPRKSPLYFIKTGALLFLLIFWRPLP